MKRENFLFVIPIMFLNGCTTGPIDASPVSVEQRAVELYKMKSSSTLSPKGYAIGAMREIDGACASFFDNIAQLRQNTGFAHDLLQVALPASNGVLLAAKASAGTIAKWTAGISVTDAAVQAFARDYAYSQSLFQIKTAVEVTMQDSQSGLLASLSDQNTAPMDEYVKADFGVRRYARYCSISSIEALAASALINAKPTDVSETRTTGDKSSETQARIRAARSVSADVPIMPVYRVQPR